MSLVDIIFDKASQFVTVNWDTLFFARDGGEEMLGYMGRGATDPIIYASERKLWSHTASFPVTGEKFIVFQAPHKMLIMKWHAAISVYNGADAIANLMIANKLDGTGTGTALGDYTITLISNDVFDTQSPVDLYVNAGDYVWIEITDSDILEEAPTNAMFQIDYKYIKS